MFLPPGVLTGVSFGLLVLSVFVVLLVSMRSVPAAMGGFGVSFGSGWVDRLSIPATGDACTGVRCSCWLLGELTGNLFEIGVKLWEVLSTDGTGPLGCGSVSSVGLTFGGFYRLILLSRLLILMPRLLSLLG